MSDLEVTDERYDIDGSPDLFRVLAEASLDLIRVWDMDGHVVYASPSAVRFLGKYPTSPFESVHPDDMESALHAWKQFWAGSPERLDVRIQAADGTWRWWETWGAPLTYEGKPHLLTFCRDITERLQTIERLRDSQQMLRQSHELFNAIIEGTSDAIFAKSIDGRYLMINAASARFFGKTPDQVVGRTDRDIFPAEVADTFVKRDSQLIDSGISQTFEEEHTVAGVTRTYVVTKNAYRDWQGSTIGLVGISSDVTELKRLENQFREAQKMESIGRLAGGVAHDFNNLLTVINSYSDLLLDDLPVDHPDREALREIRRAGDRAASLTRQLLAFSRNSILQPRVVNLNSTLADLLQMLRRLIGEDVTLTFLPDTELGLTKVDPTQLDQAIINLAVNARDAMPDGGSLTIETRNVDVREAVTENSPDLRSGQYIKVSVTDSGHGMDDATKARAFEPFFTTKGVGKGTGLGLAMVYGFVNQSGGHIDVTSTPGEGTTFSIYLPRSYESDSAVEEVRETASSVGTETVLLVEDEDAVRRLTSIVLKSHGYTVVEARDGLDALAVARNHEGVIHLLITDLVMPRVSGRELAEQLAISRPEMRVLFMSGYTDEATLPRAVTESHGAFLQKPFNSVELVDKVRDLLDRT